MPTSYASTVSVENIILMPTSSAFDPAASVLETLSVLHVVNGEHFSGAERVQAHLGRCLPNFGVKADFVSVKPGRFADYLDHQEGACGNGFRVPMKSRFDLLAARQIAKLATERNYSLMHAHTPRTALATSIASRLSGIPWIYHVHSPAAEDSSRQWANRMNAWIENLSLKNVSHLITVSNSLRRHMISAGWDAGKVTVVHNGVPAVCPPRKTTPRVGGKWQLGMVALMRQRKGLEVALEAISHLKNTDDDVHLRFIGPFETESYERMIHAKVTELQVEDRVEFVGFAADVPQALSNLDAMVLPSLYGEGLPMVVLEAMAAGLPVIATDVEGTPEAIRHGQEGLLAIAGCPISLAEQIHSLVEGEHTWLQLSAAAYKRHAEHFSDAAMAEGTAAVYRRVLEETAKQ
ncbi:Capsular glucan synthase [Roseimaritima multifibrata]|uniref:Capsular glucan synthase n=1 Tax=Roseimaritima multifibrata TaxID=1930274 RepID=A0A517MKF4_9BACT|nr:glycosyltransferase [Roseimaritima multifibrata]QDS95369.1 Capsular glucan synthase [Roseimaritima multifibrata]